MRLHLQLEVVHKQGLVLVNKVKSRVNSGPVPGRIGFLTGLTSIFISPGRIGSRF